ncbi:DUF2238 domain-containing protein [Neisseria weaveri]|uniref:Inner membrane protein yjdF n=1 Tax=Neisseria weaveri TaxID=28091 RepID=A0A448VL71_9NEIS|nr:DUF2238 domain-containing protein [Neisseria weaveri]EGV38749.1 hypothetical protein l11_01960 [Neisseria weaveri LMG 5135]SAY51452.1 Inner membrane protein yjdF [Neisseria weaveri]VEJ50503.1 Inner membrane protein yjdF [Neisseria weaveri]
MMNRYVGMLLLFAAVLVWSGIQPKDYAVWALEVSPAVIGAVLLSATYRRFRFSDFAYVVMWVHAVVLLVGGHYTYAEVPLFDWLREPMGWSRNNYDKVGHFMQGFSPAVIAAEILWKRQVVRSRGWLAFLTVCVCMAVSAVYELIEWLVAVLSKQAADAFLGTQGYVWDTQSDMLWCLIGSLCMVLLLRLANRPTAE